MSIVLDAGVIVDLNMLPTDSPVYKYLERRTDEACFVTPNEAADIYYRLNKDAGGPLADMILKAMRNGDGPRIIEIGELIELAVEARFCGVAPHIAFTAALARKMDAPVLVGADNADKVKEYRRLEGFCRIEVY